METIFALATASGRAGIAVLRISGTDAIAVAKGVCGTLPANRTCAVRSLKSKTGDLIDQALILRFDAPNSFTGENTVEFHTHGSPAVIQALTSTLGADDRARLAEPGEFTRRALENGRLDLSQVEGLAELIDAETEAQRQQALRVFSGALTDKVEKWRASLIRAASLLEVTIDFVDEEVPLDVSPEVAAVLQSVVSALELEIEGSLIAERVRDGFEVAIVGVPNVGKSTLLNRLAGREAAITSEVAGTTRDIIEVRMDLAGLPVTFLDTAGLRDSDDKVEKIGIGRAVERASSADLRVFLANDLDSFLVKPGTDDIVVSPKSDLSGDAHGVSGLTGAGVDTLVDQIQKTLQHRVQRGSDALNERHRSAMESAVAHLLKSQKIIALGADGYDIASEELRIAIRVLESLVGRIDAENLLDEIFASFCLGK
ncbi:MAG: tRNA uridine-5-carboxymethylaminomethyl(34) synthesis GTPase MnmE [Pseudomonadota bacterium]